MRSSKFHHLKVVVVEADHCGEMSMEGGRVCRTSNIVSGTYRVLTTLIIKKGSYILGTFRLSSPVGLFVHLRGETKEEFRYGKHSSVLSTNRQL